MTSIRLRFALVLALALAAMMVFSAGAYAEDPDAPPDIPGFGLPASPVDGMLNSTDDWVDVYDVPLVEGDVIDLSLVAPAGNAAVLLFPPTVGTIYEGGQVAMGEAGMVYQVPPGAAGDYHVVFFCPYEDPGFFPYIATYTITNEPWVPSDNNFPGIPIAPSPVMDALGAEDLVDYFYFEMGPGMKFDCQLFGDPTTDFDLALYDSGGNMLAQSYNGQYPDGISYTSPGAPEPAPAEVNTYVIAVVHYSGDGPYQLDWMIGEGPPPPPGGKDVNVHAYVGEGGQVLAFSVQAGEVPEGGYVDDMSIDFGMLFPNLPKTGSHRLLVTTNAVNGYTVAASENNPLTSGPFTIPDVTGDFGDITEYWGGPWDLSTTYGFGFSMAGMDSLFGGWRQFSDRSIGEPPMPIMGSGGPGVDREAYAQYKINVDPTQPQGDYFNTLNYVATGNF